MNLGKENHPSLWASVTFALLLSACPGGGGSDMAGPNPDGGPRRDGGGPILPDLSGPKDGPSGDGGLAGGIPPFDPVCSKDKWCYIEPLPQGNDLYSVYAISDTDIWTVGGGGIALHLFNGRWDAVGTGTQTALRSVWGYTSKDVWAVGDVGTILHWDGTQWSAPLPSTTTNNLQSVWGNAANDVWAVGDAGTILHWNGNLWKPQTSGVTTDLKGVYGFATDDVWVVGAADAFSGTLKATLLHWKGASFLPADSTVTFDLNGIWGLSSNDIWAVGSNGTIIHYKGASWTAVGSSTTAGLQSIFGTTSKSITAVGANNTVIFFNGTSWAPAANVGTFAQTQYGVTASWLVGSNGQMAYNTGKAWQSYGNGPENAALADMAPPPADMMQGQRAQLQNMRQMDGSGPKDVYGVDAEGVVHYDGLSWTLVNTGLPTLNLLNSISVRTASDIWVSGDGGMAAHFDGTTWKVTNTGVTVPLRGVFGLSATEAWAVGDKGTALHYTGGAWAPTMTYFLGISLRGVWGSGSNNVFAAGDNQTILRWDGTKWNNITLKAGPISFRAVRGTSATDIYMVGDQGSVTHWDGTKLQGGSQGGADYLGVMPFPTGEAFVVGGRGTLLYSDGKNNPVTMASGTSVDLTAVWGATPKDILVSGGSIVLEGKR